MFSKKEAKFSVLLYANSYWIVAIAKIASGISGSIVYLPLRSARLNRLSDVETIFLLKDLWFLWLSVWYSVHPLCSS